MRDALVKIPANKKKKTFQTNWTKTTGYVAQIYLSNGTSGKNSGLGKSSVYASRNFLNGKLVFLRIVNDPQHHPSRNAMQRLRLSRPSERVFICFYIYLFPFFCPCFCSIIPPPSSFIRQRVVLSSNVRLPHAKSGRAGWQRGNTKLFDRGQNERSVLGRVA